MRFLIWATCTAILITAAACAPSEQPRSPAGDPAEETVARIVCRADGSTELLTPRVAVQSDGIHISVRNLAGEPASLGGLAVDAEEGRSEHVSRTAPGEIDVACWPYSKHEERRPQRVHMIVADPHGYWVSPKLECLSRTASTSILDYFGEAEGEKGDPVDIARRSLTGLKPEDVVRRAGYPEAASPTVAVAREGRTLVTLFFIAAQDGGWLLSTQENCSGSGIRWEP